jgi:hypothetical protein
VTTATDGAFWKRCNTCKSPIGFSADYCVCSVSTCNRPRTALVFCTVGCWDSHVPLLRHRDAWAIEKISPTRAEWEGELAREAEAVRTKPMAERGAGTATVAGGGGSAASSSPAHGADAARTRPAESAAGDEIPRDVLIVASKLKAYIRARSGMNTSDTVLEVLSDRLRVLCDQAIRRAAESGRRTVLDRDF